MPELVFSICKVVLLGLFVILFIMILHRISDSKFNKTDNANDKPKTTDLHNKKEDISSIEDLIEEFVRNHPQTNARDIKDDNNRDSLTNEEIDRLKKSVKRDEKGKYIFDCKEPLGSVNNPLVVGMPEYSDCLYYDGEKRRWILTDGLGNGWIR